MTETRILWSDQDYILTTATSVTPTVDSNAIFNGYVTNNSADLAAFKYNRFFPKSGTYRVMLTYEKAADAPRLDVGYGTSTTNIISQLETYNASTTRNNRYETILNIPRGYFDITFKANTKHASSSGYSMRIQELRFELISESRLSLSSEPPKNNQGSTVLIGKHKAEVAESTKTINLADILSSKYSEIKVIISGEMTASAELRMTLNSLGTNYLQKGLSSIGGTVTGINITTGSVLRIASTSILTGATTFTAEVSIKKDEGGVWNIGKTSCTGFSVGIEETGWNHDAATSAKLTTLVFTTSASTWKAGTVFSIYGIRDS